MIYRALIISALLLILTGCSRSPLMHEADGKLVSRQSLQGKWVFINIWAPWCHPCRHEIPALNAFYKKHHEQVVVLSSDYDLPQQAALQVVKHQLKIDFPVLVENPVSLFHLNSVGVVPTTFVINPSGQVVRQLLGPQTLAGLDHTLSQVMAEASDRA